MGGPLHLGLIGAFPFPVPQGSQVYAGQQARALAEAGAVVTLLSYGSGAGPGPAGLAHARVPRALSPRLLRSGPQWGKPLADAVLLALLLRQHRRTPFDALLCHNAEAAWVGLAARPLLGVPIVYVVHTLLAHELSAYGPERWASGLDALGTAIDRALARRCDGLIALCEQARTALAPDARGPIAVLPPGLDPSPPPGAAARATARAAHGLEAGRFFLYTGNLDRYQDLPLLAEAAAGRGEGAWPVVVATHDAGPAAQQHPALRYVQVPDFATLRALTFDAAGLVLTRRRPGGFPVKLLNYMEAARPIVAWEPIAPGLVDGVSARLLPETAGAAELRDALERLQSELQAGEPAVAALGAAARAHLDAAHRWPDLARATLAFVESVRARAARRSSGHDARSRET